MRKILNQFVTWTFSYTATLFLLVVSLGVIAFFDVLYSLRFPWIYPSAIFCFAWFLVGLLGGSMDYDKKYLDGPWNLVSYFKIGVIAVAVSSCLAAPWNDWFSLEYLRISILSYWMFSLGIVFGIPIGYFYREYRLGVKASRDIVSGRT